ncbi:hypothetical protein GCM10009567_15140 [Rothia amarae]
MRFAAISGDIKHANKMINISPDLIPYPTPISTWGGSSSAKDRRQNSKETMNASDISAYQIPCFRVTGVVTSTTTTAATAATACSRTVMPQNPINNDANKYKYVGLSKYFKAKYKHPKIPANIGISDIKDVLNRKKPG